MTLSTFWFQIQHDAERSDKAWLWVMGKHSRTEDKKYVLLSHRLSLLAYCLFLSYFSPNTAGRYVERDGKEMVIIKAATRMAIKGNTPFEILSNERFAIFAIT